MEGDKWASMEFWVKWKRWSYRHCSWDTLNTLSQLGGYKRVLNYCKRQEEMEVTVPSWPPLETCDEGRIRCGIHLYGFPFEQSSCSKTDIT